MDITKVFKATLKTVRLRRKDLERTVEISQASLSKQHHSSNTFHVGSTKVCHSISKLKNFLKDHRKDYIGEFSSVLGDITGMTEDERDQIDKDAQLFMRTCSGSISSLKREVLCNNTSGQLTTHRNAVIHLLENYLKEKERFGDSVKKFMSDSGLENKFTALENDKIRARTILIEKRLNPRHLENDRKTHEDVLNEFRKEKSKKAASQTDKVLALLKDKVYLSVAVKDTVSLNDPANAEIATFSKEEVQMFEKENDALLNELNNIVDEV
eukprot:gene8682-9617_t